MISEDLTTRRGTECYIDLITKEALSRSTWAEKYGKDWGAEGAKAWRPVEPYEGYSCSKHFLETPKKQAPKQARQYPRMFVGTVGNEALLGGTPKKSGMMWDINSPYDPETIAAAQAALDHNKKPREVRKGPHDCYCEIGYGCWDPAASSPAKHHGRPAAMKAMYTQMPSSLAMIWQSPPTDEEKKAKASESRRLAQERAASGSFF
jgi:hypothetical protein